MKKKILCRALMILCVISLLAACGREPAPAAEQTPAPDGAAGVSSEAMEGEIRSECLRLVSNCLEQNKSRLPLYETLTLDKEVFFFGYTGGASEVLRYDPEPEMLEAPASTLHMTNDVYYWYDEGGAASAVDAAKALTEVMLEHLSSLPKERRTFTISDWSVGEQTVYSWEDLPPAMLDGRAIGAEISGKSYDEAVAAVKERLARETTAGLVPFEYTGLGYAIGEDVWAFIPEFTVSGDNLPDEQRGKNGEFTYILMCGGNVWRMQRAEVMEEMFTDTVRTERMAGYTLSRLELSIIDGDYIEGAAGEYLRRIELDPEGMYGHMDELGFPRLAYLCEALYYEANSTGFQPEGDSYSAELLGKYMAFHQRGEHLPPPATGVICPAYVTESTRSSVPSAPSIAYVDDGLLIFYYSYDKAGVFAYDFSQERIVFSADLLTAVGWDKTIPAAWMTQPIVDRNGEKILLTYYEDSWDHRQVLYEIDTSDWSWRFVDYELPAGELEGFFTEDLSGPEYGRLSCTNRASGYETSNLLCDLTYTRGDESWRLFDNEELGLTSPAVPVPSGELEQSIHNVLLTRCRLAGDVQVEAHETLDVRTDAAGGTVCYVVVNHEGFSCAGGEVISTASLLTAAKLTFIQDVDGRWTLLEYDGPDKGPWGEEIARIFPEELREQTNDGEIITKLACECLNQALDHFGFPEDASQRP